MTKKLTISLLFVILLTGLAVIGCSFFDSLACEGQPINNNAAPTESQQIYGDKIISQSFVAPRNWLNRIDIFWQTYQRHNTHDVTLRLIEVTDPASNPLQGVEQFNTTFNAATIWDQRWRSFTFLPVAGSAGKTYLIRLESPASQPGDAITVGGIERNAYTAGTAYWGPIPVPADIAFRSCYQLTLGDKLHVLATQLTRYRPGWWGHITFYGLVLLVYGLLLLGLFWVLSRPCYQYALYLVLVLALIRGIFYASVVPPWQSPDETTHVERSRAALTATEWSRAFAPEPAWYRDMVASLFRYGWWDFLDSPRPSSTELSLPEYINVVGDTYSNRPAYLALAWPLFLARDSEITLHLYLLRLNTVLINIGIIWLAYLTTRLIFPRDNFLALGVPLFILFMPQHTHLLSTVNNGNLAELLAAATLYFMVRGLMKGFLWLNLSVMVACLVLALWTKPTTYFLPLVMGVISLFYLWPNRRRWRWWLLIGIILMGVAYFLASSRFMGLIFTIGSLLQGGNFYLDPVVLPDLFMSFWAMPGWTIFQLYPVWYQLIAVACLLALLGLILLTVSKWHVLWAEPFRPQARALTALAIAVVITIGMLLVWSGLLQSIVYRQGRFIYAVLGPLALFLVLGWRQFIPVAWRKEGLLGITIAFFLFDSWVLFGYMIPFFYSRY